MSDTNLFIAMFRQHAQLLDAQGAKHTIDDAIWKLGAWMTVAQGDLSEDDMALLCEVADILFNEGLRQRMPGVGPD
ncbi:MAG: hypothetical protein E6Q94_00260 [Burkholderiaceae bacterium]|nr:MAG: hypothetical protein E6Q94_00260 [Burkholderiaceae bacterium]